MKKRWEDIPEVNEHIPYELWKGFRLHLYTQKSCKKKSNLLNTNG